MKITLKMTEMISMKTKVHVHLMYKCVFLYYFRITFVLFLYFFYYNYIILIILHYHITTILQRGLILQN